MVTPFKNGTISTPIIKATVQDIQAIQTYEDTIISIDKQLTTDDYSSFRETFK